MSIFKVKKWWSNEQYQETLGVGLQNGGCVKVDRFNTHADGDCVVVCEEAVLKIFKPTIEENASQVLLEVKLNDVILQVDTGKFIIGADHRQILLLHPQSYSIYHLNRVEGHLDAGEQNSLELVIKHSFTRRAHSLTCGTFGNIKTRDFICVQGLDGSLSFFDQDTFLFLCVFNDMIIPGPVCYVPSSDTFVICKSTWILEIYSLSWIRILLLPIKVFRLLLKKYFADIPVLTTNSLNSLPLEAESLFKRYQLRECSELSSRQKRITPQWVYNAGEEVTSLQSIRTSSNFSSIVALTERHLCCFQDNGLMKFMLKFDFMPICCHAYIIGWYYEPGARLLVMVAAEDSKLFVYEGTSLLWSCDLLHAAISISRCFLKSLPGGLVTLSTTGLVSVSYFGTEPDLNPSSALVLKDNIDAEQVQKELDKTEEILQEILENKGDMSNDYDAINQLVKIKTDIGKPVRTKMHEYEQQKDQPEIVCPVIVVISCEEPKLVQSIQITYICNSPFSNSEATVCLDNINGTEIIETQIYLEGDADISDATLRIVFTIIDSVGKIRIISKNVLIPLSLYCEPLVSDSEQEIKLHVETNHDGIRFEDIFTDFSKDELSAHLNENKDKITFVNRNSKKLVTIKSSRNEYSIEAEDYPEIISILYYFVIKLTDHYQRMSVKDFKFKLNLDTNYVRQLIHKFLKCIEGHANDRSELKVFEDELTVLQRQFTTIQKRLLVQYGSLPPGDCDPLEFLMTDTHNRISSNVQNILQSKANVIRSSCMLSAVGNLILLILRSSSVDTLKVKLLEELMSFDALYDNFQEWQESVLQSLPFILNIFNKSEKDKEKLAPVTEQGLLSQINMKRFLKQIKLILDKMFKEISTLSDREVKGEAVTRIEEIVELL